MLIVGKDIRINNVYVLDIVILESKLEEFKVCILYN